MGMNISHWMAMISPMFSLWFPEPVRSYKKSLSMSTTWLWRTRNFTMKKMRFNRKTRDPTILWIYTALKRKQKLPSSGDWNINLEWTGWSGPKDQSRKQASSLRCRYGFNHGEFNKKMGSAWIRWFFSRDRNDHKDKHRNKTCPKAMVPGDAWSPSFYNRD
jgi:hypothetical protein